jgi:Mor family transcriptional regulator
MPIENLHGRSYYILNGEESQEDVVVKMLWSKYCGQNVVVKMLWSK